MFDADLNALLLFRFETGYITLIAWFTIFWFAVCGPFFLWQPEHEALGTAAVALFIHPAEASVATRAMHKKMPRDMLDTPALQAFLKVMTGGAVLHSLRTAFQHMTIVINKFLRISIVATEARYCTIFKINVRERP